MDACEKCEPEEYSTGTKCIACADATECPCFDSSNTLCYSNSYCYNTGLYYTTFLNLFYLQVF